MAPGSKRIYVASVGVIAVPNSPSTDLAIRSEDPEWPGVPQASEGSHRLLSIDSTLVALFHKNSDYGTPEYFDQIYVLSPRDDRDGSAKQLRDSITRIAVARAWRDWNGRFSTVEIFPAAEAAGGENPDELLKKWISGSWRDPLFQRYKCKRDVVVNCTAGDDRQDSWLRDFDWEAATKRGLGETTVKRIAERGDLRQNGLVDEKATAPFEEVKSSMQQFGRKYRKVSTSRHEKT